MARSTQISTERATPAWKIGYSGKILFILSMRVFALSTVAIGFSYLLNNYLVFWRGWPGFDGLFAHLGWFGVEPLKTSLGGGAVALGWIQIASYLAPVAAVAAFVMGNRDRTLRAESENLSDLAGYIIRAAFWGVVLVGLADAAISFLRVEDFLQQFVGHDLTMRLGLSSFRGTYILYPLIGVAIVIAFFTRSLGFPWLALLIVVAEMQIVISRFVFSYEQAFMADLVRFWYGALFLFASAYTLLQEGHVRVDIFYAGFSERGKAWTNTLGSVLLGVPLCWIILTMGMAGKLNVINGPLLSFEVTQSGYGMYVKYLLAGFLVVYAITMMVQFMSFFLSNLAVLVREPGAHSAAAEHAEKV